MISAGLFKFPLEMIGILSLIEENYYLILIVELTLSDRIYLFEIFIVFLILASIVYYESYFK